MRICILSTENMPIGFLDNDVPDALHFYDDKLHVYLTGTAHTLELSVIASDEAAELLAVGNKLAFYHNERPYYLNIVSTSQTETEIEVEAWAYCLELLNENATDYAPAEAHTFTEYFSTMIFSNDIFEIGINEVSTHSRKCEFTGSDTLLKRLYSLASEFDAELEFVPRLNEDYSLDVFEMNVYREHSDTDQGVGEKREDMYFRYGGDIDGITKTQDITELYTMIVPTGKDDLSITSIGERKYENDDGVLEYWHPSGSAAIYAPLACQNFPSAVTSKDKYIRYDWSTDYETAESLYGNALAKLKEVSVPESTYEIKGSIDVNIGDTITVIDEAFSPSLYLETRVTEQEICFTDPSKNSTTFSNTKELESQIDDTLTKRVEELAKATASATEKADSAVSRVETVTADVEAVKTTASEAKEAAETATETANTATATATQASADASTAKTSASQAVLNANNAVTLATSAQTSASNAETKASNAESTASSAVSTATKAQETASSAQSTAESAAASASAAQTQAETANTAASEAKTEAQNASSAASTAQSTAEAASTAASTAQSTAESAQTTANTANETATAAQTTATEAKAATDNLDTLIRATTDGVEVARIDSEGAYTGMRTEQTADAYLIKDKDGNTLASYGADTVELGKGNTDAVIDMCNKRLRLLVDAADPTMAGQQDHGAIVFRSGYGSISVNDTAGSGECSMRRIMPYYATASIAALTYKDEKAGRDSQEASLTMSTSGDDGSCITANAATLALQGTDASLAVNTFAMADVITALNNGLAASKTYTATSGTIQPWKSTNSSNAYGFNLTRMGNIVYLEGWGSLQLPVYSSSALAEYTIPSGFRPITYVRIPYIACNSNNEHKGVGAWTISTGGVISVSGNTNTTELLNRRCQATWITTDDYPT